MSHPTPQELEQAAAKLLEQLAPHNNELKPKERMQIPAQEMPAQDPAIRRANFEEVATGYSQAQARV